MNYQKLVKEQLSEKRYQHSIRVAETAVALAQAHKCNETHAEIAGLLHDFCKEYAKEQLVQLAVENSLLTSRDDLLMPQILHGPVASYILKREAIIENEDILQAIRYHTTGHPDMNDLAKIIFIADYIEPGRKTPHISGLFEIAAIDLDRCVVEIIDRTIQYLLEKHSIIHEDMMKLRNRILIKE
ncbi:MAG: bis(5'-nucleosyl)-tetraphosphatase (symmetrical) YqeK [Peptococcaceae bacterium]|nr:bis(5'-nucleosyl)-tetraphosphatase (symmetrical) YqeK [Peptococcaceae bacterium]